MFFIAVLLAIAAGVMAVVVPSLPTADAVFAIVVAVVVLGFVIWLWLRGGGGLGGARWGGWGDSGRMGN